MTYKISTFVNLFAEQKKNNVRSSKHMSRPWTLRDERPNASSSSAEEVATPNHNSNYTHTCLRPSKKHAYDDMFNKNDFIDTFLESATRDNVRVCGKDYSCRRNGDGMSVWTTAKLDDAEKSNTCIADSLFATAHVNGCNLPSSARSTCRRERPFLAHNENTYDFMQVQPPTRKSSGNLPDVMEAHWKCDAGNPSKDTHRPTGRTLWGRTEVAVLNTIGAIESGIASAIETMSESPTLTDEIVASGDTIDITPPPPEQKEWTRCTIGNRSNLACDADSTCPLSSTDEFNMLWNVAEGKGLDKSGSLNNFLESFKSKINDSITWNQDVVNWHNKPSKFAGLRGANTAALKTALKDLYDADVQFKTSMQSVFESDPDFVQPKNEMQKGRCQTGYCKTANNTPVSVQPTNQIYRGQKAVTFELHEDGKVRYSRGSGPSHEVFAHKCNKEGDNSCDSVMTVVDAVNGSKATVDATHGQQFQYKLRFSSDDYIVNNVIEVKDESTCAARICENNGDACPHSACQVIDGKCSAA